MNRRQRFLQAWLAQRLVAKATNCLEDIAGSLDVPILMIIIRPIYEFNMVEGISVGELDRSV